MSSPKVTLASASPRRQALLGQIIDNFQVHSADIDETALPNEKPEQHVARLAFSKAQKVALEFPSSIVIGSDTVVTLGDRIFGKPSNQNDSIKILKCLSGKVHTVMTAVAVIPPTPEAKAISFLTKTQVEFADITQAEMQKYWLSGEPQDKAGSYAIQGIGGQFVKSINGSYSSVVGLPLFELKKVLHELGVKE